MEVNPFNFCKTTHCPQCNTQVRAQLVRNITRNGASQVYWFCLLHQGATHPASYIKHELITNFGVNIDDLPVKENYSGMELCAVCGSPTTENHHWAPSYLFADDSNRWPQSPLCPRHHRLWHQMVTPNMTEGAGDD